MVWLLRKCTGCHRYTLKEMCPHCGGATVSPHPAKYSPDDKYQRLKILMRRLSEGEEQPQV